MLMSPLLHLFPPKALPLPQLRGGCLVLLALLSPWVKESQQVQNNRDTSFRHRGP